MPRSKVSLPTQALQNFSESALQHIPPKLQAQLGDPGIYFDEGMYGAGPGWYHVGMPADQVFLGHRGQADYYVLDFNVTAGGMATSQGADTVTQFERAIDGVIYLDSFAVISPGVSYSIVATGSGPQGPYDGGVDYSLVHLAFIDSSPVQIDVASLGSLAFADLV